MENILMVIALVIATISLLEAIHVMRAYRDSIDKQREELMELCNHSVEYTWEKKIMPYTECGECKFHKRESSDFRCTNEESEYFDEYTDYGDTCNEFEEYAD